MPASLPRVDFFHWPLLDIRPACREIAAGTTHAGRTPAHWRRVALIVTKRTGHKIGLDTSTRMAMDADFSTAVTDPKTHIAYYGTL